MEKICCQHEDRRKAKSIQDEHWNWKILKYSTKILNHKIVLHWLRSLIAVCLEVFIRWWKQQKWLIQLWGNKNLYCLVLLKVATCYWNIFLANMFQLCTILMCFPPFMFRFVCFTNDLILVIYWITWQWRDTQRKFWFFSQMSLK